MQVTKMINMNLFDYVQIHILNKEFTMQIVRYLCDGFTTDHPLLSVQIIHYLKTTKTKKRRNYEG